MKKALYYSVACRFEGMLRRVLHALAEEALFIAHRSWHAFPATSLSLL